MYQPINGWKLFNRDGNGSLFTYNDGLWLFLFNTVDATYLQPLLGCLCEDCRQQLEIKH